MPTKQAEKKELVIEFKKPYVFENKEYTEVDLSGLEDLNGEDLIAADQELLATGKQAMVNELSLPYLLIVASKAAKKPSIFFEGLPAKETVKVKNTVMAFLNN